MTGKDKHPQSPLTFLCVRCAGLTTGKSYWETL